MKPKTVFALLSKRLLLSVSLPALIHSPTALAGEADAHNDIQEVVVSGARPLRSGALDRNTIIATEVYNQTTVDRVHAVNINEVLDKRPGIAVQTECSICNVRNVSLNNLPGRFTTIMIDSIPLFSSLSSAYGLDSVNVRGIERIEVSRGAGTSLIAPEAISGVVNIVSKRPTEPEFESIIDAGDFGWRNYQLYGGNVFDGGAFALNTSYQNHNSVDAVGSRISQYTGYERTLIGAALFLDDVLGFRFKGRADIITEDRGGGSLGTDYDAIKQNVTGNPFDWSKGTNASASSEGWDAPDGSGFIPWDLGRAGLSEIIFTDRASVLGSAERDLSGGVLKLAGGYAKNEQDSFYEHALYAAESRQAYSEISYYRPVSWGSVTFGANYRFEDLISTGQNAAGENNDGLDDYEYKVPGIFAQAYVTGFDKALEVNLSARYDDHNVFGEIFTPRVNILWHHSDRLSSRLAIGRGYRAPTSFFEQDHGILDTRYVLRQISEPEKSDNASYALSYSDSRWVVAASYNWMKVKNIAVLDSGQIDTDGEPYTLFTTSPDAVTVQGVDVNASYRLSPQVMVGFGAEKYEFDFVEGTLAFSRPDSRLFAAIDYDPIPALHIFARATWTGQQDLERFYGAGRYNFDGTPKRSRAPAFTTIDAQVAYYVKPDSLSVYVGIDNLTDYVQADKESMLWIDDEGAIDVTHIWGPSRGRFVYAGIKYSY
ncbi:MAG: TonB-dependent receptor [Asticcacaulis sp.]